MVRVILEVSVYLTLNSGIYTPGMGIHRLMIVIGAYEKIQRRRVLKYYPPFSPNNCTYSTSVANIA